jgi:hypothetical protein
VNWNGTWVNFRLFVQEVCVGGRGRKSACLLARLAGHWSLVDLLVSHAVQSKEDPPLCPR